MESALPLALCRGCDASLAGLGLTFLNVPPDADIDSTSRLVHLIKFFLEMFLSVEVCQCFPLHLWSCIKVQGSLLMGGMITSSENRFKTDATHLFPW